MVVGKPVATLQRNKKTCMHVRHLFLFKAFQPLLVIYLYTVVLETLKL